MLKLPVKRPLAVLAFFVAAVVVGTVSLQRLPVSLMPDIALPKLTVTTGYSGAGPRDVERHVTTPLEESLGTIGGVTKIVSRSHSDRSEVVLYFNRNRSMNYASVDVREKLEQVEGQLPEDAGVPAIRQSGSRDEPITSAVLHGGSMNELSKHVDEIRRRVARVAGAGRVEALGKGERTVRVTVNPEQLSLHNVTMQQISQAIAAANVSFKLGELERRGKNYLVQGRGRFQSLAEIRNVSVAYSDGSPLYLDRFATVKSMPSEESVSVRYNGQPAVAFQVYSKNEANVVRLTNRIQNRLDAYEAAYLPEEASLSLVNKKAGFVEEALAGVNSAVVLGSILAFLVVLVFLGDVKNSVIVLTAIPVSILVTFVLLQVSGMTLNLMTLGGLALGAGMLIDNSIVVLESIERKFTEGRELREAIPAGLREVSGAVVASTLTTVAVFFPIVFMQNFAARMFQSLALVVAFSLFASLFVALLFIPALVVLFNRYFPDDRTFGENNATNDQKKSRDPYRPAPFWILPATQSLIQWIADLVNEWTTRLAEWLEDRLVRFWDKRARVSLMAMATIVLLGYLFYLVLPIGFFPQVNSPNFVLTLEFPSGTPLETTQESISTVEEIIRRETSATRVLAFGGQPTQQEQVEKNVVRIQARLPLSGPGGETVQQRLSDLMVSIDEQLSVNVQSGLAFGNLTDDLVQVPDPIEVHLEGNDFRRLEELSGRVVSLLSQRPRLTNVRSNFRRDQPKFEVKLNRQLAARSGLSVRSVTEQTRNALKNQLSTSFESGGEDLDVRVELRKPENITPSFFRRIPLITQFDESLTLDRVSSLSRTQSIPVIRHEDGERRITVSADVSGGSPASVLASTKELLDRIPLPENFRVSYEAAHQALSRMNQEFLLSALFAAFLVYLTMAGQFNLFLPPLVVMFSVPMAFVGAFAFLYVSGYGLSVVSSLGLLVLTGIVVNNAILIVDLILQLREDHSLREACFKASKIRVRPVLMTTLTTGLALIPLLFMTGEASSLQRPLALSVLGGLVVGTLLILIYIPLLFGTMVSGES